jgi:hypothetical protein
MTRSAFREIDPIMDSVLQTLDINGDDYPLVNVLIAILRAGRYRSTSPRQLESELSRPLRRWLNWWRGRCSIGDAWAARRMD